jgi:plasmid maintenance system antidote protein VapI
MAIMAHRLGRLFGNGPQLWLSLQQQVELWDALHMDVTAYESIERSKSPPKWGCQ